jgi:hypothetical protein
MNSIPAVAVTLYQKYGYFTVASRKASRRFSQARLRSRNHSGRIASAEIRTMCPGERSAALFARALADALNEVLVPHAGPNDLAIWESILVGPCASHSHCNNLCISRTLVQ